MNLEKIQQELENKRDYKRKNKSAQGKYSNVGILSSQYEAVRALIKKSDEWNSVNHFVQIAVQKQLEGENTP